MSVELPPAPGRRKRVFVLELSYLVILFCAVGVLCSWHSWHEIVPDPIGPVPLAVPWFGALGGVMISLRGIFDHDSDWDPRYDLRHIARPLTAAVTGTVAYLIVIGGVVSVGQTPSTDMKDTRANVIYYVLAFATGYREEGFRDLLRRAVDAVLGTRRRTTAQERPVVPDVD